MIPALEHRLPAFVVRDRVATLRQLLGLGPDRPDPATASHATSGPTGIIARLLDEAEPDDHWVIAAVMTASLPLALFVDELSRAVVLGDIDRAADMLLVVWVADDAVDIAYPEVRVIADPVLVDVFGLDDDRAPIDTRRVSSALLDAAPADALRVTWTPEYRSLVAADSDDDRVVVPYGGSFLSIGICDEPPRAARLMSLAETSSTVVTGVGYGLGPLTHVELFDNVERPHVEPRRYAWHIATNRVMQRVVTVSETAQLEMEGWKSMLPALGVDGPRLVAGRLGTDPLPVATGDLPPRLLVAGTNSAVGDFEVVAGALALLPPDLVPAEILRLDPADGTSIDFEVEGVSTAPVVDLATLRASDVVVSCAASSSHDVLLESLVAAGIRSVVAESGFASELEGYPACRIVPPRDALALSEALHETLGSREPAAAVAGRSWSEFTDLVWSTAVAPLAP